MRRGLLLVACAFAAISARAAVANARCHDASRVVGRQTCRHFGSAWEPVLGQLDVGIGYLRYDQAAIDALWTRRLGARTYQLSSAPGTISAVGPRWRVLMGFRGFYFGYDATLGSVQSAPHLSIEPADAAARSTGAGAGADGTVVSIAFVAGKQVSLGPLELGAELSPGMRWGVLSIPDSAAKAYPFAGVLEGRVRAGLWLTHWLSASAIAGTSLLHRGDYSVGILIGLHLFPYDGTR